MDLHPDSLSDQKGGELIDASKLLEGLHNLEGGDRVLVRVQGHTTLSSMSILT